MGVQDSSSDSDSESDTSSSSESASSESSSEAVDPASWRRWTTTFGRLEIGRWVGLMGMAGLMGGVRIVVEEISKMDYSVYEDVILSAWSL